MIATIAVRGPLRAVIVGIGLGSLAAWVTVVVHEFAIGRDEVFVITAYHQAAWYRLLVAAVVLAAAVRLARVWYRTGQPLGRLLLPRLLHRETDSVALPGQWSSCGRPCRGRSIRLLWQAWRQIRAPAVVYWGCCLAALIGAGLYYRARMDHSTFRDDLALGCTAWAAIAILGFSSLLAGYTFGADQKARFLQLARDGVSPREIWLSRVAVMATVLLLPAMVVLGLLRHQMGQIFELSFLKPLAVLLVALGYFSALVIGQASSMFVRSRIIALLAAPAMIACFASWIGLAVFWAGLGWKLGAAPMLLALLIGTRLLAGTRLRQDNSWRALRLPVLLVVVAVVFSYQALAYHRAHEIQPYDSVYRSDDGPVALSPGQLLADAKSLGEREGWELVSRREQIEDTLVPRGDDMFLENRYLLAQPWHENNFAVFGQSKTRQVTTYSAMLMTEAELNRTLRDVTAQSDIPNERLRACVDFLEDWPEKRSSRAAWLAAAYQRDLIWLQHGPVDKAYGAYGFHCEPLPSRYRWFSFERKRMLKLLDRAYRIAAERAQEYEKAVINDQVGVVLHDYGLVTHRDIIPYQPARSIWYQVSTDVPLIWPREHGFRLLDSVMRLRHSGDPFYNAEAQRRGTILYLALRMYYNDHDRLPESLDALVEGEYLSRLPMVPIARKAFYYEPSGVEEDLLAAIKAAHAPESLRSWPPQFNAPPRFEHDDSAPFLWYPFHSDSPIDPCSCPGWFIDLDFVEQQDRR